MRILLTICLLAGVAAYLGWPQGPERESAPVRASEADGTEEMFEPAELDDSGEQRTEQLVHVNESGFKIPPPDLTPEQDFDAYVDAYHERLWGRGVTREEVGPLYDKCLYESARRLCHGHLSLEDETAVARLCRIDTPAEFQMLMQLDDPKHAEVRDLARTLHPWAQSLAMQVSEHVDEAWADGYLVEIFDPKAPHDRKAWLAARGLERNRSNYHFTTNLLAGDRAFVFHFRSSRYPALDGEMATFQSQVRKLYVARERAGLIERR